MNITVYLGANIGKDEIYRNEIAELGRWIGRKGHRLIYGGSSIGLMGVLADGVLSAGGEVVGVEPLFFVESEFQHDKITKLIVTEDMPERKKIMIDEGDAYIAFPGGTGTLEEISEVISLVKLGFCHKPCILYNLNGFYNDLKAQLERMTDEGFVDRAELKGVSFVDSILEIEGILDEYR